MMNHFEINFMLGRSAAGSSKLRQKIDRDKMNNAARLVQTWNDCRSIS